MNQRSILHETSKYPTSLIVRGSDALGVEIARTLLEQGGFVILIDNDSNLTRSRLAPLKEFKTFVLLDFTALDHLDEDLRRLDYIFYFQHKSVDLNDIISTQEFLQYSNYLDQILDLTTKFDAKFLLTTAIKAHQMVISDKDLDWNFGIQAAEKHTVYTEVEIQRYSESLVKEYQEKVGIDARVVRLGILLGKDIELQSKSPLVQLLLRAIANEDLIVPNDGLETDYYVHYLDAAYGIIKAQFSLNTKGYIFTLANEEEISVLSIAYKLLELEPQAKEIKFIQSDDQLPPLKLYKPAEHIAKIGWKPRVSFERALAHTLEDVKEHLQQRKKGQEASNISEAESLEIQKIQGNKTLRDKIFNFFFVADADENGDRQPNSSPESETTLDGALAKLIADRKNQEKARKGSIILANSNLRTKVKAETSGKNIISRLDYIVQGIYLGLRKRFEFLRNITLMDFLFTLIALIALGIIYFSLVSPILSLGRNIFYIKTNLESFNESLQKRDFLESKIYIENVNSNLDEAQLKLQSIQFLFDLSRNHKTYLEYQQFLSNAVQVSEGYEEVFTALEPLAQYFREFQPKLTYRFTEGNILSVEPQNDYQLLLSTMRNHSLLFNIGVTRIQKNQADLLEKITSLPQWITDLIKEPFVKIDNYYDEYAGLNDTYNYLPQLLGLNTTQNMVIVFHDNARYTAGGGEIAGFMIIQLYNGAIKNIITRNFSDYQNVNGLVSAEAFSEIKLLGNNVTNLDSVKANDLSLISDTQVLYNSIQVLIENKEKIHPDFILGINLNDFAELLKITGEIEYQTLKFSPDSLLTNINLLMGSNPTGRLRNDVILNIGAKLTEKILNNLEANYPSILSYLAFSRAKNDLRFYSTDLELGNFLANISDIDQTGDK